jgi:hypothetical protein
MVCDGKKSQYLSWVFLWKQYGDDKKRWWRCNKPGVYLQKNNTLHRSVLYECTSGCLPPPPPKWVISSGILLDGFRLLWCGLSIVLTFLLTEHGLKTETKKNFKIRRMQTIYKLQSNFSSISQCWWLRSLAAAKWRQHWHKPMTT